ncbi:hypothetical protein M271_39600 [Streptomyces rapamycinicus NRRL 5491]|nr:hypothetical protein M271_39600 [Streptomyces rapamycinicus NRRL 5491]
MPVRPVDNRGHVHSHLLPTVEELPWIAHSEQGFHLVEQCPFVL